MFTETDLDNILITLGRPCTVGIIDMSGIYRVPAKIVDVYSGAMATTAPTLLIKTANAVDVAYDTPVTVAGIEYRVLEVAEEQTGFTRLMLSKDY